MKHLFRFLIKAYATIWYIFKFRKIPKIVKVTTMYGYVYIDGNYFLYDEDAPKSDNTNIAHLRFRLEMKEFRRYLCLD